MTPFLEARDLRVRWGGGRLALDGVTLGVGEGETLGVVGESGAGKTTLGRALLGLVPLAAGQVRFRGVDMAKADKRLRRRVQPVFQDPDAALDPRRSVAHALAEPLAVHGLPREPALLASWLERVGLPGEVLPRFPHQLSSGQRQRVALARALVLEPELVVCDEPLSALDPLRRAQVLDLLGTLRRTLNLSLVFISHDVAAVTRLATRVAVLHAGQLVEVASTAAWLARPLHPASHALLRAWREG